jgi:hypothetical protein
VVWQTTTVAPYRARDAQLPPQLADVHKRCREIYDELYASRLPEPGVRRRVRMARL